MTSGLFAMLPGVLSTIRSTRSGWCAAVHATTQPPSDSPDRCARSDAQRVHQPEQVVGEDVDGERDVGQRRPAVPDHVVGGDAEAPREARDVAGVGLEVPAGAVEQDEIGAGTRAQHAGPYAPDPADLHGDVAQLVVDVGELAPDAHVVGDRRA